MPTNVIRDLKSLLAAHGDYFIPSAELAWLRENEPISRIHFSDRNGWLVTNYQFARAVLSDTRFSSDSARIRSSDAARICPLTDPSDGLFGHPADPGDFLQMDPPEHTKYRRALASYFTMRKIDKLRPVIMQNVEKHLNVLAEMSRPVDFVEVFARPFTSSVAYDILGIPEEDRSFYDELTRAAFSNGVASRTRLMDVSQSLRELIIHKRKRPQEDLLTLLAVDVELTDDELSGTATHLLVGSMDNPSGMLTLGLLALLCHKDQFELLREHPSLVDRAVEELLRFVRIFPTTVRSALEEIEVGKTLVGVGDIVVIALHAANHDPDRFENPDTLEIGRENCGHLSFSHGIHQCIGKHLARIEMGAAYVSLAARFPTLRLARTAEHVLDSSVHSQAPPVVITW